MIENLPDFFSEEFKEIEKRTGTKDHITPSLCYRREKITIYIPIPLLKTIKIGPYYNITFKEGENQIGFKIKNADYIARGTRKITEPKNGNRASLSLPIKQKELKVPPEILFDLNHWHDEGTLYLHLIYG